jgi:ribosomal protein S18 acetylase RimI-like enzyme
VGATVRSRSRAAAVSYRPGSEIDRSALKAFIDRDLAGTSYAEVPLYFLHLALEGRSAESSAVVAERNGDVMGFALYGHVAGSVGAGRLHFISVTASARLNAIGVGLCNAAVASLGAGGARLVVAEVPDDPVLASGHALLARCGFVEAARVEDYYRDGVALMILARSAEISADNGIPGADRE